MLLEIKVVAGAGRNEVVRRQDGGITVRVSVAPEKGRANKRVVDLLSDYLQVKKSAIAIVRGFSSPRKVVEVNED